MINLYTLFPSSATFTSYCITAGPLQHIFGEPVYTNIPTFPPMNFNTVIFAECYPLPDISQNFWFRHLAYLQCADGPVCGLLTVSCHAEGSVFSKELQDANFFLHKVQWPLCVHGVHGGVVLNAEIIVPHPDTCVHEHVVHLRAPVLTTVEYKQIQLTIEEQDPQKNVIKKPKMDVWCLVDILFVNRS